MILAIAITIVVLLGVLTLSSYVERIYHEKGKFLSREFQENIEEYELKVEPRLHGAKDRAPVSFAILTQLTTASIAVCIVYLVMSEGSWDWQEIAQAVIALVLV